jgi:hypothetical protein
MGGRIAMPPEPTKVSHGSAIVVRRRYSLEFANKICEMIADGDNLSNICKSDDMPYSVTVRSWMRLNPEFEQRYNIARRQRADARSDRMDRISRDVELGVLHPEVAKVMLSNERWQASKENAGRYGDKVAVDLTARVDDAPAQAAIDWSAFDIEGRVETTDAQ